jgi:hypothetical protein
MAKHSQRDTPDPTLKIDGANWQRIEKAYGAPLPPDLRESIVRATEAFLFLQSFERSAEPLAKVKVILEAHDKAATRFFHELFGGPSAVSDAGVYAHYLIENNFKASQLAAGTTGLDAFLNLLRAFHIACNSAIKQLNGPSLSPAVQRGDAWKTWISQLRPILSEGKLPVAVRKDDSNKSNGAKQSSFVPFVWELQKCLPTECRHAAQSEPALADALRKAFSR